MKRMIRAAAAVLLAFGVSQVSATVIPTPTADPVALVSTVIGTGIVVSGGTETFVGGDGAGVPLPGPPPPVPPFGIFSGGTFTGGLSAGLGFDEGIVLTSGDVTLAPGPNVSPLTTGGGRAR